jgi:hypothetical protein
MAAKLFKSFDDVFNRLKYVKVDGLNLGGFKTFDLAQFNKFLTKNETVWKNLDSIDKRTLLGITTDGKALTRLAALEIKKVDDLINIGIKSVNDLADLNITSVNDLKTLGITTFDALKKLNVRHISDLNKVGIKNFDDLSELGLNSVDDLVKLKITSMSQLHKFGLNSVDDLKKFKIKSADDLVKIGIKNADDLKQFKIYAKDLNSLGINADDIAKAYNKSNVGVQFIKNNAKTILYVTGGSIAGFALFTKEGRDSILKPLIQTSGTIIGETTVGTAKALWDLVPESFKTAIELFIYLIIGYIFTSMLPPGTLQNVGRILLLGFLIYLLVIAYARNDEIIE